MPRLSDLIEAQRDGMAAARVALLLAEANLNGLAAALATEQDGFRVNDSATRATLSAAVARVHAARHALDEARFGALGIETLNGRPVCGNDPDDMGDALLTRLERNHYGEDGEPADGGLIRAAHRRGADLMRAA